MWGFPSDLEVLRERARAPGALVLEQRPANTGPVLYPRDSRRGAPRFGIRRPRTSSSCCCCFETGVALVSKALLADKALLAGKALLTSGGTLHYFSSPQQFRSRQNRPQFTVDLICVPVRACVCFVAWKGCGRAVAPAIATKLVLQF
jgi:hypothetical protein